QLLDTIGADNVMLECDYPHSDSTWPETINLARKWLGHLPDDVQNKITIGNAARVYNFTPADPATISVSSASSSGVAPDAVAPLAGLQVVEFAAGVSVVGAGLAPSLPGALLRDFGADVTRVQPSERFTLDEGVEWPAVWDRGKHISEWASDTAASKV